MSLPDIAIINFSSVDDPDVQHVIRAVNRQVQDDFMPIWGSGYDCKLHASPFTPAQPAVIQDDPVQAEGVIYLIDQPNIQNALGYHDMNNAEVPVGFVFTDLGEWTVTLSHEVLELIIDPTVNIFVPGPDPREPGNANAWLLHSYEVCDAVERFSYDVDGVAVSDFVTPQYFREGDAPGTRNDFLGVGVDSFGVTNGSHLGVIDPSTGNFVIINGAETENLSAIEARMAQFSKRPLRGRPDEKCESALYEYQQKPAEGGKGLQQVKGFTRLSRYKATADKRFAVLGKR